MRVLLSVILVACLAVLRNAAAPSTTVQSPDAGVHNVNLSTILMAVGTPLCMRRCVGRLAGTTKKMISFENTTQRLRDMCEAYNATNSCLAKKIGCQPRKVFEVVTSGMQYTCMKKRQSFERVESCLEGKIDTVLKGCDASCHLRANLSAFSSNTKVNLAATIGGNLFMVAENLEGFCGAARCMLPCVTERANSVCPLSGWLMLDAVLQPFDAAAAFFAKSPPLVQQLVREKLSTRCHFLFSKASLQKMRKGDFQ